MKLLISLFVVLGVAAGAVAYYTKYLAVEPSANFRPAVVKRGDLLSTISATGTVEPEEVVDVGAQVVGRIKNLGIDPGDPQQMKSIDYGSVVHDGTVLAEIDPAIYKAQVDQAQASLKRAKADLLQMKAKLEQAEREWSRAQILRPTKAIADTDYDLAKANYDAADANVAVGEAAIQQAQAALDLAKTSLDYTVIKSPVEGVIIARRVNVGQTVVSSLNAPSLFLIAKDLSKIQVWASVNEADIGRIRSQPGMPVRFTVDAYPGEVFRGKVAQIRLNATMTQNVVTYTVVVSTDNPDLKLLPYLTANLQFEVEEHRDVLMVANAALRWRPRPEQIAPEVRETAASAAAGKGGGPQGPSSARSPGDKKPGRPGKEREERGRLWVKDENFVRPIDVQIGLTDGSMTEVSGSQLQEAMEVVIGEIRKESRGDGGDTTNPFAPKMPFGRGRGSSSERAKTPQ
jgi:HlyD family secretion protein